MNAFLTRKNYDHHTGQRHIAIAALAGKIDQHDSKGDSITAAGGCFLIAFVLLIIGGLWAVTQ